MDSVFSRSTQPDRQTWLALAERCEKATGPDREVDLDLVSSVIGKRWPHTMATVASYTDSLDAITALIERELPGWRWKAGRAEFHCWATIYGGAGEGPVFSAVSVQGCAALALCAAFCRAMAEKASA